MKIHIHQLADCDKCGLTLTSFLISPDINLRNITFTDNPKICDLLIVVGCLTKKQLKPLVNFWKKMPLNRKIVVFGNCGTEEQDLFSFKKEEGLINLAIERKDLSEVLPVDKTIKGCPPSLSELEKLFIEE